MLIHKAFRFRFYPTPAQRARLALWETALRWLWNLANEQRQIGLARSGRDKVYVRYAAQNRELTALRSEYAWLSDVPADLCQSVLKDLDTAWQRHFSGMTRVPRYKSRAKDHRPALRCEAPKRFRLDSAGIEQFPKLGRLKTVMHRPIEGVAKTCALVREGDQWFVSVTCRIDVSPPAPRSSPSIGIARVTGGFYATSTGELVAKPVNIDRTLAQLERAQRTLERRKKGSQRSGRARQQIVRLQGRVRRQRAHALHVESKRLADSQGNVVIDRRSTIAGCVGPGVSDTDWHTFASLLEYKLAWAGGRLIENTQPHPPTAQGESEHGTSSVGGVAAAISILSAWESHVPARGRQGPVEA